jgi:hypothetical protein
MKLITALDVMEVDPDLEDGSLVVIRRIFDDRGEGGAKYLIFLVRPTGIEPVFPP